MFTHHDAELTPQHKLVHFCGNIVILWGEVEKYVELGVQQVSGKPASPALAKQIRGLPMWSNSKPNRLKILTEKGYLTEDECSKIRAFKNHRDRLLFHNFGTEGINVQYDPTTQERILEDSGKAVNAIRDAFHRRQGEISGRIPKK